MRLSHLSAAKRSRGSGRFGDVFDPNTGEVQAKVALANMSQVEHAIANAQAAQPAWAATNPQRRVCVVFSTWCRRNTTASPASPSEHGKTLPGARRHPARSNRLRHSASRQGRIHRGAGPGIDLLFRAEALGVVAGITAVQFPGDYRSGNVRRRSPAATPSSSSRRNATLLCRCGLPSCSSRPACWKACSTWSMATRKRSIRCSLTTASRRSALSAPRRSRNIFITPGRATVSACSASAAPNHMIVMPDADMDQAVDALIGAGYGSAGELMAISVAVPVGKETADTLLGKLARGEPEDRPLQPR